MHFLAVKKSRKRSGFVTYSYFKDSAFTLRAVKNAKFETRYVKRVPFINRGYTKEAPFRSKLVYKRVRGWISGLSLLA